MLGFILAALMCLGALIGLAVVAPSVYYSWRIAPLYYNLARLGLPLIALLYFGPRALGLDFPGRQDWISLLFLAGLGLVVLAILVYLYREPGHNFREGSHRLQGQPVLQAEGIVVRNACPEDLPQCGHIFAEAFHQSFDLDFGPDRDRNGRILSDLLRVKIAEVQVAVEQSSQRVVGAMWLDLGNRGVPAMTFSTTWPVLRRYLNRLHAAYFSIYAMPAIMARRGTEEQGYIQWLGVDPQWQGQHIGRVLVERAIELSRAAGKKTLALHTERSNERARKLYSHAGFEERNFFSFSPRIYYVKPLE